MPATKTDAKVSTGIDHLFKALAPLRKLLYFDNSKLAQKALVCSFR